MIEVITLIFQIIQVAEALINPFGEDDDDFGKIQL